MSRAAGSRASELTRQDVIDAAAGLVAERGYAGLTMRALAQRCGVPTMTLYRHVRDKEDMLGALADRVLADLQLPEAGSLTWQEELAAVFGSVHDLLLTHPDVAVIAARQPVAGEAAYRGAEVVLDALRRGGVEGEPAASAFATLFAYTIGFVQQQLLSSAPGSLGRRQEVLERLPRDDFDNLSRLGAVFLLRSSDRHFQDGLDLIISGLESKARTRAERPLPGWAAIGGGPAGPARPVQPGGTGQEGSRRNHRVSRAQGTTMTPASTTPTGSWIDAITPRWLTTVLRAAAVTEAAVRDIETRPLGVASAAGDLARLSPAYEPARPPGPATIIAKAPGSGPTQRAMEAAMGLFARERYVYAELASALPVRLPRCYYPGDPAKQEPMLLEDLRELRAGDQVTGLGRADAERLIDVLAGLHAAYWEAGPPGGDASRLVSWADPALGATLTQLVTSGVAALRQRYAERVPARILTAIADAAPHWADVLRRCAEGPQTFVHNDFRLDNIFFQPDGEPVVIDWQLAGRCRGTQDLAYLLSGSMPTDTLRTCWDVLLRRYHARLSAAGVRGYGLHQCRFHYRQSLLYTLAPGIAMLGQMQVRGGDARGLADTLVLRTLTHASDLDAFATL